MEEILIPFMGRRQVLLWVGTSTAWGLAAGVAVSQVTQKTIDRRVRSEAKKFGLTFAAEAPTDLVPTGHAFIVWQHEDDNASMSIAEAIGFYPTGDPSTWDLVFGTSGKLESDLNTEISIKLTVLLNSDQYQAALDAKEAWQANGQYRALWQNCTTHVSAIASAIGLATSGGTWQYPLEYVEDLVANNN